MLDAKIAFFKRRVSLEEQKAQTRDEYVCVQLKTVSASIKIEAKLSEVENHGKEMFRSNDQDTKLQSQK